MESTSEGTGKGGGKVGGIAKTFYEEGESPLSVGQCRMSGSVMRWGGIVSMFPVLIPLPPSLLRRPDHDRRS